MIVALTIHKTIVLKILIWQFQPKIWMPVVGALYSQCLGWDVCNISEPHHAEKQHTCVRDWTQSLSAMHAESLV